MIPLRNSSRSSPSNDHAWHNQQPPHPSPKKAHPLWAGLPMASYGLLVLLERSGSGTGQHCLSWLSPLLSLPSPQSRTIS